MLLLSLICFCAFQATSSAGILYPRPSETREVLPLDGIWNFALEEFQDRGQTEEWFTKRLKDIKNLDVQLMPVPSSYNDIVTNSSLRDYVGVVWYQRSFFVPKNWNQERVWLRFSSVCYTAEVWVNGESAVRHEIGHLPFQVELFNLTFGAENTITVAVSNRLNESTVPQGNNETLISGRIKQTYAFDFFNYAGIDRSVVLYTTPNTYIDDISIETDIDDTTGLVNYSIAVQGSGAYDLSVLLIDQNGVTMASDDAISGILQVPNANFWWPYLMNPLPGYLYNFEIRILDSSNNLIDIYRQPIGIRKISWDSNNIHVNNKPIYLRGFGRHEDSDIRGKGFDFPLITRDHNLIKWLGANSYRTSHYPYAEEILDMADQIGIMIISETSACSLDNYNEELLANHKQAVTELVARDKNRPSVIMWSVANEPNVNIEESEDYFRQVIDHLKSLETTRPATLTTFYSASDDYTGNLLDVASFNAYKGWYENVGDLDVITPLVVNEIKKIHEAFNIPVMMTEYGADTEEGLHLMPSAVWSEEYQEQLMSKHFEAFDALREEGYFIGEHIWNFADFKTAQSTSRVGGNKKGIFTRNRQPKASAHLLRKRYWSLAAALDDVELPDDLFNYISNVNSYNVKNEL